MKRYFRKKRLRYAFWEIAVRGDTITERFGTHGTLGASRETLCASDASAEHRAQHMIAAKIKDGYREQIPIPVLRPSCGEVDLQTAKRFLECLEACAKGPTEEFFFNPPASSHAIAALETECQITLPDSLRSFLSFYNGGFIWRAGTQREYDYYRKNWTDVSDIDIKREVSFVFYSVEEIRDEYKFSSEHRWGPEIIPFFRFYNGEQFIVWHVTHTDQESRVIFADHELDPFEWRHLYATFAHLFIDYVERRGNLSAFLTLMNPPLPNIPPNLTLEPI